jgi:hypothetical protein
MKSQFGQADLNGWNLTLNNGTWNQLCKPAKPVADPPTFSFPQLGPNNVVGLSARPGNYWNDPQPPNMPVGSNTGNTYMLSKVLPATNKGGQATLKARCLKLSNQFLAVYISTDMLGCGSCVGKLWNAPFPGKPAAPYTNFQELKFTVPAGICQIQIHLQSDINRTGATMDIYDFMMPE